jgi:hypothetical protein
LISVVIHQGSIFFGLTKLGATLPTLKVGQS